MASVSMMAAKLPVTKSCESTNDVLLEERQIWHGDDRRTRRESKKGCVLVRSHADQVSTFISVVSGI